MRAYVGQTRAAGLLAQLRAFDIGECTQRGELVPRRAPWFYDNGAFTDWQAGRAFDVCQFWRDLRAIRHRGKGARTFPAPDFVTIPDRVADWPATVALAHEWAQDIHDAGAAPYLVVQDGAELAEVLQLSRVLGCAGLFVGGSLPWKLRTAARWVELAHGDGMRCHIGRVGTADRVRWARDIGADSIDSCLPLWDASKLAAFLDALTTTTGAAARLF